MRTAVKLVTWVFFCTTIAMAQERPDALIPQGKNFEVPEGWQVRLDHEMEDVDIGSQPDSSDIYFVNMTPGWHITTGPAGIFYHPANTASGIFDITSEIHFFDPGDRNREAYGLFLGGSNLQNEQQKYIYFLIRNTGEFLIKERSGSDTKELHPWTASDLIKTYEAGVTEGSSVMNTLLISVSDTAVSFHINDDEVASMNADELNTDGIFGLRVNHSINLHISDLSLRKE